MIQLIDEKYDDSNSRLSNLNDNYVFNFKWRKCNFVVLQQMNDETGR